MKMKSNSVFLLVLVVVLLVVVSSRIAPEKAYERWPTSPTDDPYQETETPQPVVELPGTPPPERPIRELLPNVSLSDWNLKLVNNYYVLGQSFAPNVAEIGGGEYFEERAAEHLLAMIDAAEGAGHTVAVRAAYRPYSTQAYIFFGRASQIQWGTDMEMIEAEELARKVVAYPGTSEHQLGLAVDLLDSTQTEMEAEAVKDLPVLQWLTEHCAEYGFVLRYPEDKQELTGWFEPWHVRYVGEECARYMMENDLCLEEFIARF